MKRRLLIVVCFLILLLSLWLGNRAYVSPEKKKSGSASPVWKSRSRDAEEPGSANHLQTKAAIRKASNNPKSHSPERLKQFMMPDVFINGLTLEEAMRKLMTAYEDACAESGQTPLRLSFMIPPGVDAKLKLHTGSKDFDVSVRLLAALAGVKVSRKELIYQFEQIENLAQKEDQSFSVPPDFTEKLKEMAGIDPGLNDESTLEERLKALGFKLDPSTHLSLSSSGQLSIQTTSGADASAISTLVQTIIDFKMIQQKFVTKIITLTPEVKWELPKVQQLSDAEMVDLMRELVQQKGVNLMTAPSIAAKSGQPSVVELLRELTVPSKKNPNDFETHQVGIVINAQGKTLGFGSIIDVNFNHTNGDIDPATRSIKIDTESDITTSGFSDNANTKFAIQKLPDGSRKILFSTTTLIDATGRPINHEEAK